MLVLNQQKSLGVNMDKYDTLLTMGGAHVISIQDYFCKNKKEIKDTKNKDFSKDNDVTVFEVTILNILHDLGITTKNAIDYDMKLVLRKK